MTVPGVIMTGPETVLASRYDVTGLAADAVAWAASGAAELLSVRNEEPPRAVTVDRVAAAAAFAGERLLSPIGWSLPPIWDPLAGDYRAADGWVRLHTNYPHHRAAVLAGLDLPTDGWSREVVAAAVAGRLADDVESAVVAAGGPAAALHPYAAWKAAVAPEATAVDLAPVARLTLPPAASPYAGVRVLDLTRVIAGPVATRYLAAYGADVLRIDPPHFPEVPALLPEVTPGKRCAFLDLTTERARFLDLVRQAHVLVCGLRAGALERLGLPAAALRAINPGLVIARLNAYGWAGPWTGRRGFDSLVQMSCGIAYVDDHSPPSPLPVQALDHATGHLLAGWIGRALAEQLRTGHPADIRTSLVATAGALIARERPAQLGAGPGGEVGTIEWPDSVFETMPTVWGPARRVRVPGTIAGVTPRWSVPAGPLGRHPATFA
ncbi:CoA transferase [Nakamurella sp.]|uniref:CoA transferase n=1 Tax=Nakamurella sp. TaxID=1869182 RepID=UPI003B3A6DF5